MARLEAQSKLLYYPTSDDTVDVVSSYFKLGNNPQNAILVDPCCGKGFALDRLARNLSTTARPRTWGIELSYSRSRDATELLDIVAEKASFYDVIAGDKNWPAHSVGLIFNNPPYDWSGIKEKNKLGIEKDNRHEILFITGCTPKIAFGGHQIIIIPRGILGNENLIGKEKIETIARHILGYYEKVIIGYVDTDDYHKFKQIVVLAFGKLKTYVHPKQDDIDNIVKIGTGEIDLPVLPICLPEDQWIVPESDPDIRLMYTPRNDSVLLEKAEEINLVSSQEVSQLLDYPKSGQPFHPAMPLSVGHIAMLITGQQTGELVLKDKDTGELMVVKGMATKTSSLYTKEDEKEKHSNKYRSVTEKERFTSHIAIVRANGIEMITSVDAVRNFIAAYAGEISRAIFEKNNPIYNWDYSEDDWGKLDLLGLGLKRLVNREEHGLFPIQRHIALANARVLRQHHSVIDNGEMGVGKTIISLATLYILNKWPVFLAGPTHMLIKYFREFGQACDPNDPVDVVIIERPTSQEKWVNTPVYAEEIQEDGSVLEKSAMEPVHDKHGNIIVDQTGNPRMQKAFKREKINQTQISRLVDEFEYLGARIETIGRRQVLDNESGELSNRRTLRVIFPSNKETEVRKIIGALGHKYIKKGTNKKVLIDPVIKTYTPGIPDGIIETEYVDTDPFTLVGFMEYRHFWREKVIVVCGYDSGKYDSGYDYDHPAVIRRTLGQKDRNGKLHKYTIVVCPTCGEKIEFLSEKQSRCESCNNPIYNFNKWHRTGAGKLLLKKWKHFFKVYISDEVHKGKSISTDVGVLDNRLISACKYNIGLTGTIFGGDAASLFPMLYRRLKIVRDLYPYNGLNMWMNHYGLYEKSWTEPKTYGYGTSTNIRRFGYREKALPGVSPAIIRYLLPITIFSNITDLGYDLPDMKENIILDDLATGKHADQMEYINQDLLAECIQFTKETNDPGALSFWYNQAKYRPMSAFRDENPIYVSKKSVRTISLKLPKVVDEGEWLPKEKTLANLVGTAIEQGRKSLIYVEQTESRDIRQRLIEAVKTIVHTETGSKIVSIGKLSASDKKPIQREAWITTNAPHLDALVVHPGLVETGLDLVMFHNIIFYELSPSLYRVWQAMRRVWRLGQTENVLTYILGYRKTVEREIMARMGKKMQYAYLLYGKDAGGVLIDEDSEELTSNNMVKDIISDALEGKAFKNAGEAVESIFGSSTEKQPIGAKKRVIIGRSNDNGKIVVPNNDFLVPINIIDIDTGEETTGVLPVIPKNNEDLKMFAQLSLF